MRVLSNALTRLDPRATVRVWRFAFCTAVTVVTVMSLLPSDSLPPMLDLSDKLQHALAYAALAILAAFSWQSGRTIAVACAMLIALGGTIELLQLWVPGRSGEWLDFAADTAGVIAGFAPFARRLRRPD